MFFSLRHAGAIQSFVVPSFLFEGLTFKKPAGEIPKTSVVKHPYFEK